VIIDGAHENQDKNFEAQDPENWKFVVQEDKEYYSKKPITTKQEYHMSNKLQGSDNKILELPDIPIVVITSTSPKDDYNFWTHERKKIWRNLQGE